MTRHMLLVVVALIACKKKQTDEPAKPVGSGSAVVVAPDAAVVDAADANDAAAAGGLDPGTLSTPESVLYDEGRDMYMVANIAGKPTDVDDNGYLTVVNPDGSNARANANWKWIAGEAGDIELDAPKGMAISGDTLYVADITVVRRFEAKAGKQKDDVKIAGATFLNDVTPDGNGGVFVSDSGLDADFSPNGSDAVYHVDAAGKVTTRIKQKDLGG
ncbi:MAG TPA: hypothetical protein VK427_15255, partial [Kofleriaceae bacterium]|nr:hypothetical protein [Kofleriaceae bacterium]